jgi:hypothetical protein
VYQLVAVLGVITEGAAQEAKEAWRKEARVVPGSLCPGLDVMQVIEAS